ncbi:MAG TPA: hypothetical protein VLB05_15930 [Dongiaceae bacterium]|nr:hypothetical protein [Dongiaceae bacterium]
MCAGRYRASGSTYLRAFQLAELAARRLGPVRVRELAELDDDIGDEVLIFNKSCLQQEFRAGVLERLPALRRRAVCLADPIDLPVTGEFLDRFDGVIASSLGQVEHLASRHAKPVFLIHHHVDTRLAVGAKQWDHARIAYFGELVNTWHGNRLGDIVDFFSVDTTNALYIPWAQHLPFYNVHYCLRRTRPIDGFKPASKLFLAASLGALVVIEKHNDEARRLLPRDYPYYAESTEPDEIRTLLGRVAESFGKEEWRYAGQSMAAIDCYRPERVLDQVEEMMRKVA